MMGFAVPVTFSLVFSLMFLMHLDVGRAAACSSDEYEAGRCCLCPAGSHVSKHCTQYAPRSCTSCPDGTYLQAPNKRTDCFTCNNCSAAPGLKVKSPCTSTSNAVCGPSEGFYCVHLTWEGCFQAEKHSSCRPGQYVVKEGTSSTDTVCADCPPSCECIKAGNHSNDSTPEEESHSNHSRCEHMFDVQTPTGVFVVAVALVVLVVGGIVIGGAVCVDVYGVSSSSHDVVAGCIASGVLCYWLFYYTVISGCMGYVSFFNLVCSGVCLGVCVGVLISVVEDTSVFFGGFGAVHGGIITFIIITTRAGNDVVPCIIVLVFIDVVVVVGLVILPLIRRSCQRIRGRRKNDTHEVTEGPSKEDKQDSTEASGLDWPDHYPQSNGLAEKTVQTAKAIMDKAHAQRSDPYLSLLEYRNTPVDGFKSPAQLLMSRCLRSILPITEKQLQPELACHSAVQGRRELCQKRQKQYYDRNAKSQPTLPVGATVRFQQPTGTWKPATVVGAAGTQRSYNIFTDEGHTL